MATDHLITFTAEMIRAVRERRKTQTRRVISFREFTSLPVVAMVEYNRPFKNSPREDVFWSADHRSADGTIFVEQDLRCPYGVPGDRLLCQEGYQITCFDPDDDTHEVCGYYLSDGQAFNDVPLTEEEWRKLCARKFPMRATPGRFMYRSLCRTILTNRGTRGQQVQKISKWDARAEGAPAHVLNPLNWFMPTWDSINAKRGYGWDVNSWVWAVSFELQDAPSP